MKTKKILSLIISTILITTSLGSVAFADDFVSQESFKPSTGVLMNENDKSWLDGYEIISSETIVTSKQIDSSGISLYQTDPSIPGGEDIIRHEYNYKTFTYGMSSVVIAAMLTEAASFIPYKSAAALGRLAAAGIAYKVSQLPVVHSVCTYYYLRGANGQMSYALAMSNYSKKDGNSYSGYIDGTYHNVKV